MSGSKLEGLLWVGCPILFAWILSLTKSEKGGIAMAIFLAIVATILMGW